MAVVTAPMQPSSTTRLSAGVVGLLMTTAAAALLSRGQGMSGLGIGIVLLVHGADVLTAALTGRLPWCADSRHTGGG